MRTETDGDEPVGIALTPTSLRQHADGTHHRVVNLSSWYVRERFRWRAGYMLRNTMADKRNVYTDLTPAPELQTMLPKLGMRSVNQGVHLHPLPLLAMQPAPSAEPAWWHRLERQDVWPTGTPWQGPSRALVEAHRELGCLPLVLEHRGEPQLVIGLRTVVRGLPALQLVYARDRALVLRHLRDLARLLLRQGLWVFMCESTEPSHRVTALFSRRELWFVRGQDFANRTDVFASELSLSHAPAAQALSPRGLPQALQP